jgi:hypothetical protein
MGEGIGYYGHCGIIWFFWKDLGGKGVYERIGREEEASERVTGFVFSFQG